MALKMKSKNSKWEIRFGTEYNFTDWPYIWHSCEICILKKYPCRWDLKYCSHCHRSAPEDLVKALYLTRRLVCGDKYGC